MNETLDISKAMYDWARDLPPKVISRVSPSQLGGCNRKHYYNIKHVPITTPTNPGAILNMQTGFMWENIIKESLEHAHIPFMYQYKLVDDELNMEGTIDFVIFTAPNVVEIWDSKTESSLAARFRKGSYFDSHPDYMDQLNSYALLADRAGWTIARGGFIVIRRDDSLIENFPFQYDSLRLARTMEKIKKLNAQLASNTIPECDGKYCALGLCEYGNPATQKKNAKGKMINTECCPTLDVLERWRTLR